MKRALLWVLTLALLVAPAVARAEGEPIGLPAYQERLRQVADQLDMARQAAGTAAGKASLAAARQRVGTTWAVQTPEGTVTADLRDLARLIAEAEGASGNARAPVERALALAREYLQAAEAAGSARPVDLTAARKRLELALASAEAQRTWYQRLKDWWRRLWNATPLSKSPPPAVVPYLKWGALAIGVVGVLLLGRSLVRTLAGNAGGEEAAAGRGRVRKPDRPPTPEELREESRQLAAAGDFQEALRTAHLALLKHLDQLSLLRFVPAQTLREHERQLRRNHPGLARAMRGLNDLVEARLYSGHGATAEDFNRGEAWVEELWREGDAASKRAEASTGESSPA
ncbi:MAG TPA: hypothetical protein VGK74_12120 [Symbiobacteriaceae bacterium]|jgi:hypothetical protein